MMDVLAFNFEIFKFLLLMGLGSGPLGQSEAIPADDFSNYILPNSNLVSYQDFTGIENYWTNITQKVKRDPLLQSFDEVFPFMEKIDEATVTYEELWSNFTNRAVREVYSQTPTAISTSIKVCNIEQIQVRLTLFVKDVRFNLDYLNTQLHEYGLPDDRFDEFHFGYSTDEIKIDGYDGKLIYVEEDDLNVKLYSPNLGYFIVDILINKDDSVPEQLDTNRIMIDDLSTWLEDELEQGLNFALGFNNSEAFDRLIQEEIDEDELGYSIARLFTDVRAVSRGIDFELSAAVRYNNDYFWAKQIFDGLKHVIGSTNGIGTGVLRLLLGFLPPKDFTRKLDTEDEEKTRFDKIWYDKASMNQFINDWIPKETISIKTAGDSHKGEVYLWARSYGESRYFSVWSSIFKPSLLGIIPFVLIDSKAKHDEGEMSKPPRIEEEYSVPEAPPEYPDYDYNE
jgi:hypothetical protein